MSTRQKLSAALVLIFLCGIGVVAYVYIAGADRRAIEKTLENVRTGVKNADSNLVLAQVSKDYNYDGYSYAILQITVPVVLKNYTATDVTFSNMEIKIDGTKARATFHFVIKRHVQEVLGVTVDADIITSGDAEVTLAKESGKWKITEVRAHDK